MPVHNRYEALELDVQVNDDVDEGPSGMEGSFRKTTPCIITTYVEIKRRVVVIGDY